MVWTSPSSTENALLGQAKTLRPRRSGDIPQVPAPTSRHGSPHVALGSLRVMLTAPAILSVASTIEVGICQK